MPVEPDVQGCRVLVLEDELMIALDLCGILESLGCTPLGPANSVEEALALLEREPADVAMVDENIDGASVAPVAASLQRRAIPFVVISGYSQPLSDDAAVRAAPRLAKPFTRVSIKDALGRLQAART